MAVDSFLLDNGLSPCLLALNIVVCWSCLSHLHCCSKRERNNIAVRKCRIKKKEVASQREHRIMQLEHGMCLHLPPLVFSSAHCTLELEATKRENRELRDSIVCQAAEIRKLKELYAAAP